MLKKSMDVETILSKIKVVEGDCAVVGLGLSDEDRKDIIENVEIIYHSAATVKFDEKLKRAIELNTRGAYEMTKLGLECKKLLIYCHISTAYCHVNVKILKEQRYEPPADPYKMMNLVDCLTEEQIDLIEKKLLGYVPNTYSFTKSLAEAVVFDAIDKGLPGVIMRPSIVTPIYKDPLPGWNDNQNGPSGLLIAAGRGILRTSWIDQKSYGDFVPADFVANSLIIGAWGYLNVK
jgi:alcohol-forming fatty acyl-CoA reductase